jgi:hypothetical protein
MIELWQKYPAPNLEELIPEYTTKDGSFVSTLQLSVTSARAFGPQVASREWHQLDTA